MLRVVKDWVTWGEVDADTLAQLLRRRGRLVGDKPLTDDWVRKYGWGSLEELALAYVRGEVDRLACTGKQRPGEKCIPGLKPFFRLRPPTGGFRSIKKPYNKGGDLGYRGPLINELIMRSI
jgi:large subunit ribosomal protein L30